MRKIALQQLTFQIFLSKGLLESFCDVKIKAVESMAVIKMTITTSTSASTFSTVNVIIRTLTMIMAIMTIMMMIIIAALLLLK